VRLIFQSKHQEKASIWTFKFEPTEPIQWLAGQSIRLELPAGFGTEERRFTIVSAPYEEDISITTRISDSDFKQALNALEPGDSVEGYNIDGEFVWSNRKRHHILCASGIGITAYVPMLKQLQFNHAIIKATLLYANHDDKFIYDDLLKLFAALNPGFSVVWLAGTRLSPTIIAKHCPHFTEDIVYLSGPSAMVDEVGQGLIDAGMPEQNLLSDWFTGRPGWHP
jgi:ferredoxin-NADP reductase